jgi:cinnamoyl-CoA:phenyllactate CoA-transferase
MKDPAGKEAFFKLLDTADVLITNWRVQALQKMGLDYENLKGRYPKLVYAICTGYGEYGPDKNLPGFDFTAFFARGGYLDSLRQKGTVPMNVVPGLGDHNVGMNLAAGILAALYQAKVKGVGEKVETSLFESAIFNMGMMVQASNYEGIAQQYPIDVRKSANPFNAAWRTKDDRFIQTCMPDYNTYYKAFITAVGRADLVDNENYFPILTCQKKGLTSEVYDIIMDAFSKKTVAQWQEILVAADIPFSVAQNWVEIRNDKQAEANNCFYDMKYSNGNTRRLVRLPVKFQEMGVPDYKPGPMIGEQGTDILKELGYGDAQIKEMLEKKTLFVWKDEQKN